MTKNLCIKMLPLHSSTLCKNCNQITIASVQFIEWTYMQACNTVKPAYNGKNIICTFVGLKFFSNHKQNTLSVINFRKQHMEQNYLKIQQNCFLLNSLYSVSFLFKPLLFIADNFALTALHSLGQRNFLIKPVATLLKVLVRQVSLY